MYGAAGNLMPERHSGRRNDYIALYDEPLSRSYITPANNDIVLRIQHQYGGSPCATLRSIIRIPHTRPNPIARASSARPNPPRAAVKEISRKLA